MNVARLNFSHGDHEVKNKNTFINNKFFYFTSIILKINLQYRDTVKLYKN